MNHHSLGQLLVLQDMEYSQTKLAPLQHPCYNLTKPNAASSWFSITEAYMLTRSRMQPRSSWTNNWADKCKSAYQDQLVIRQETLRGNLIAFWKILIRNLHHLKWRSHNLKSQIEPSYSPGSIRWMIKHNKFRMQSSQQGDRVIPNSRRFKLHTWVRSTLTEVMSKTERRVIPGKKRDRRGTCTKVCTSRILMGKALDSPALSPKAVEGSLTWERGPRLVKVRSIRPRRAQPRKWTRDPLKLERGRAHLPLMQALDFTPRYLIQSFANLFVTISMMSSISTETALWLASTSLSSSHHHLRRSKRLQRKTSAVTSKTGCGKNWKATMVATWIFQLWSIRR